VSGWDGLDLLGGWRCVQFAVDGYCCLGMRVVVSHLDSNGSMINVFLDDFCFNVPALHTTLTMAALTFLELATSLDGGYSQKGGHEV
jgi:hypothetical protein